LIIDVSEERATSIFSIGCEGGGIIFCRKVVHTQNCTSSQSRSQQYEYRTQWRPESLCLCNTCGIGDWPYSSSDFECPLSYTSAVQICVA